MTEKKNKLITRKKLVDQIDANRKGLIHRALICATELEKNSFLTSLHLRDGNIFPSSCINQMQSLLNNIVGLSRQYDALGNLRQCVRPPED